MTTLWIYKSSPTYAFFTSSVACFWALVVCQCPLHETKLSRDPQIKRECPEGHLNCAQVKCDNLMGAHTNISTPPHPHKVGGVWGLKHHPSTPHFSASNKSCPKLNFLQKTHWMHNYISLRRGGRGFQYLPFLNDAIEWKSWFTLNGTFISKNTLIKSRPKLYFLLTPYWEAAYCCCKEKTSDVSNYVFFTLLHEWVDKGQTHQ